MKNMEETQVEMWNDMKNTEENVSRIDKRYGKCRNKLWNDMENTEERQVK
jgi:hypothetical protein